MRLLYFAILVKASLLCIAFPQYSTAQEYPNILLIISDDLGMDATNGYQDNQLKPTTPHLDALQARGLTFTNAWATPMCTPTRATIMSGKYGVKTGVVAAPGNLDLEHTSIFNELEDRTQGAYADALIGKWHISQPVNFDHPFDHGVDHYELIFNSGVTDYYNWEKVVNGQTTAVTDYATTHFTNSAIEWINDQNQPWFLWLAHVAPHSPFHTPPDSMYTINQTNNNRQQYMAMIEAMDFSIGRLLDNIPDDELANTLIIYIGDNGTPNPVLQNYPDGHGKSTVYQGGINVPLIIAGAGVERSGEKEDALVQATDLYATILEMIGEELPGGIHNSKSFAHLLDNSEGTERPFAYSEIRANMETVFAIRNERFKLISFDDGTEEFYDLQQDSLELNDLLPGGLNNLQSDMLDDLRAEAVAIRDGWSCRDLIQNGDEAGIDCGGSSCVPCITSSSEASNSPLINVYPNPAKDHLNIDSEGEVIEAIRIFSSLGQLLHEELGLRTQSWKMPLENINNGLLLIEINTPTGTMLRKVMHIR